MSSSTDAHWLPFVSELGDERILEPDGDPADRWRRWFGLPLRTEAAAAAAAERAALAAKREQEAAEWQRRADQSAPKTVDELRARLARVSWCARCAQGPTEIDLPFPAVWLSTWDEVKARAAPSGAPCTEVRHLHDRTRASNLRS
jgi:hypothetical protein